MIEGAKIDFVMQVFHASRNAPYQLSFSYAGKVVSNHKQRLIDNAQEDFFVLVIVGGRVPNTGKPNLETAENFRGRLEEPLAESDQARQSDYCSGFVPD